MFKVSLALLTGAGFGAFSVFSFSDELDEPDEPADSEPKKNLKFQKFEEKNLARKFKLPEDELEAELLDTDDDVAEVALVAGFLDLFAFTMELPKK